MTVVIELTEKEIKDLAENAGIEIEDSYDAEYALHFLMEAL